MLMTIDQICKEEGLSRYKVTQIINRSDHKHLKGEKYLITREEWERMEK